MNPLILRLSYFFILYGLLAMSHAMERDDAAPPTNSIQTAQK